MTEPVRTWLFTWTLALALGGCGEEDRTPVSFSPSADRTSVATDDSVPRLMPVALVEHDTSRVHLTGSIPVAISSPSGTGVSAEATLSAQGGAASVALELLMGLAGTTYDGAVHQGSCTAIGTMLTTLVPVTADSLGRGRSSTDLPMGLDSLITSSHVLVIGRSGTAEGCGEITGVTSAPPNASPSSTPTPAPPTPPDPAS